MKLNKQLLVGISLAIIICAVSVYAVFYNITRERNTSELVYHSQEEIEKIQGIIFLMQDCETGARGFVITNEEAFQEPFKKAIDSLPKVIAGLNQLNRDDVLQQKNLASLLFYVNKKIKFSRQTIETRRQQGLNAAMQLIAGGSGKTDMDSIRSLVGRMTTHETFVLRQWKAENQAALNYTNNILLTIIGLFLIILFPFARKVWIYLKAKIVTEAKLKESNERFNFVAKATSDAIYDLEMSTGTIFWSNNFELLFGYPIHDNKGDLEFWEEHIHPEDKQGVLDGMNEAIKKDSKWQDEYRFLKADGNYVYVLDTAAIIRNQSGEVYRMTGSMRDITYRKVAEMKLQESEANYRQIVETAQEGIWIIDSEYRTVFANKKMGEMLEFAPVEMVGKRIADFMDDEGKALEIMRKTQIPPGKEQIIGEYPEVKLITKSGRCIYTSLSITNNVNSDGELVNGMAMVTDITNRKLAEEQLQISEGRLRLLIENIKDYAIFIVDTKGVIVTWNMGAEKLKGYLPHEIIGMPTSVFYNQEQRNNKEPEYNLEKAKQNGRFETEGYRSRKDGSQFWADVIYSAIYDENGKLYGFAKIVRDITEKRLVEKRLKEVTDKLYLATNISNIGIWEWNFQLNTLEWDETSYRLFGLAGEGLNNPLEIINTYVHPDDRQHLNETNTRAIRLKQRLEVEYRVIWPDQSVHHIESRAMVLTDAAGKATKFIGTNLDITRRKKGEDNERNLHTHIQLLLNSTSEGLYGIDNSGTCTFINQAGALMLGYKPLECIGQNMHSLIHYKKQNGEELLANDCAINIATWANQSCSVDTEIFWKADGSSFDVQYASNPIIENFEQKGAVVTFSNITESKTAQKQLIESERNLHAILFSTQEGLYLLDNQFRLVLMNKASEVVMRRMTDKECNPGEDFLACFDPEIQDVLQGVYNRVLKGEQVKAERQTTEYGKVFYYSANYFPVKDENGVITNICCTSSDITEKKLAEEIINAANDEKDEYQYRFQSIVDNSPQAVLIKNLEGYFTFINKSFIEAFGIPPEDVIGKRPKDIFTDPLAVVIFDADEEVLVERKIAEWEQEMTMRSGEKRHFQIIKFPVYDRKETLFGIGTICKDITEIKNYEYKLIKAREKAEIAERLQEQFLANMSHELRTPMNGIIGMANVLANTGMQPQQKQQLKIIQQSSDTLLNLINDILDLSKIKAGMLTIEKVDFDFNETIALTASVFKDKTIEKGIRFIVQTEPFISRFLSGDPLRLTQILNNLLSNAIKFTEKGFVKLEASLLSSSDEDVVIEFIISDSGIGIEQSSLYAIFNSFEQASSEISRKYGGTGLGLPITKRLIELQGGEITVESNPGKGSVFTFSLPYNIPKTTPLAVINPIQKYVTSSTKRDYSGKHVLVVEDNEITRRF